jgi:hypothetical protein
MVAYVMPGDRDTIDGREVVFTQSMAIGHKVAVRDIKAGERIYKCGIEVHFASTDDHPTSSRDFFSTHFDINY